MLLPQNLCASVAICGSQLQGYGSEAASFEHRGRPGAFPNSEETSHFILVFVEAYNYRPFTIHQRRPVCGNGPLLSVQLVVPSGVLRRRRFEGKYELK